MANGLNTLSLTNIPSIDFNSSTIGNDINDRLEIIDDNFKSIVGSDFLRGADGADSFIKQFTFHKFEYNLDTQSTNVINDNDFSNNDNDEIWFINSSGQAIELNEEIIRNALISAITSITTNQSHKIIIPKSTIYFLCKQYVDDRYYAISSLPYTYMDSRFHSGVLDASVDNNLIDQTDLSGNLTWSGDSFEIIQNFPTLYWDSTIDGGCFCWKMNNIQTGLIAQGPQGIKGENGNSWIVKVVNDSTSQNTDGDSNGSVSRMNIDKIFYQLYETYKWYEYKEDDKGAYISEIENPNESQKIRISFGDKNNCLCIYESEDSEHKVFFGSMYENQSVSKDSEDNNHYWYVWADTSFSFNQFNEAFDLVSSLSNLANADINGIFVPYTQKLVATDSQSQSGHMIWSESIAETSNITGNHSLHIGPVKNVLNNNLEIDDETSNANELNVHYGNIIFDNDDKEVKIQSKNEENLIIEGAELNLNATELNLNADDDITVNCAHITIGDSNDGSITLNGENTSVNINADGFAVNGDNVVIQGDSNVSLNATELNLNATELNLNTDGFAVNGDNVVIQGDSNVSITDTDGDSIQLNQGINISSEIININSNFFVKKNAQITGNCNFGQNTFIVNPENTIPGYESPGQVLINNDVEMIVGDHIKTSNLYIMDYDKATSSEFDNWESNPSILKYKTVEGSGDSEEVKFESISISDDFVEESLGKNYYGDIAKYPPLPSTIGDLKSFNYTGNSSDKIPKHDKLIMGDIVSFNNDGGLKNPLIDLKGIGYWGDKSEYTWSFDYEIPVSINQTFNYNQCIINTSYFNISPLILIHKKNSTDQKEYAYISKCNGIFKFAYMEHSIGNGEETEKFVDKNIQINEEFNVSIKNVSGKEVLYYNGPFFSSIPTDNYNTIGNYDYFAFQYRMPLYEEIEINPSEGCYIKNIKCTFTCEFTIKFTDYVGTVNSPKLRNVLQHVDLVGILSSNDSYPENTGGNIYSYLISHANKDTGKYIGGASKTVSSILENGHMNDKFYHNTRYARLVNIDGYIPTGNHLNQKTILCKNGLLLAHDKFHFMGLWIDTNGPHLWYFNRDNDNNISTINQYIN